MRRRVCIETSVVSYLASRPSRDLVAAGRQQLTHMWWEMRRPAFDLVISQVVLDGACAGDPGAAHQSYYATNPEGAETSAKQGVVLGGFAVFRRVKYFEIQPEAQLSQRRAQVTYARTDTTYSATYLNLSLLLRTKLFKGLYTTQGPQFSFPVRASLKVPGGTADIKDNIAKDISLVIGVGRQFGRIGLEARWDSGMKRVELIPLGGFVKRNRAITVVGIFGFQ